MEKFAFGRSGAPESDGWEVAGFGFVEAADEGWKDVGSLEVEIVAGAVEIGRHERDGVKAVLLAVRFAGFNAGDFGDGVPLVGGLEGPVRRYSSFKGCGASFG